MENIIYVFSEEDRDHMKELGYKLLKEDGHNQIYAFAAKAEPGLEELEKIPFVLSNILTF